MTHLDGSWLGELTLPDAFHQSLVEAEVSEAGDRAGRAGARHLHVVFLLQVDHLDPAQAADVGVLLVEVLGKVLVSAVKRSIGSITGFTITEKAPTRAFSWLIALSHLRHY